MAEALDSLDWSFLLTKLNHLGIIGKRFYWFRSYLENRLQHVLINRTLSNLQIIYYGEIQGSRQYTWSVTFLNLYKQYQ